MGVGDFLSETFSGGNDPRELIFRLMANELKGSKAEARSGVVAKYAKGVAINAAMRQAKRIAMSAAKGILNKASQQQVETQQTNFAKDQLLKRTNERNFLSRQATQFVKDNIQDSKVSRRRELLTSDKAKSPSQFQIGKLYFFGYHPETKDNLPFYDEFPVVMPLGEESGGFLGLNFHYVRTMVRAQFFDALLDHVDTTEYGENIDAQIRINYEMLVASSKFKKHYRPCIRSYRFRNFVTGLYEIQPKDWKSMMFLPLEKFSKMSREDVWKWSDLEIKGT